VKIKIDKYIFDASAKTVRFLEYDNIELERVLLITNVTDNIIIYNFADAAKGGSVATNVLTLEYDTTSMADDDDLLIFYQEKDSHIVEAGGQKRTWMFDDNVKEILQSVLEELKQIKLHLSIITEEQITEGEN
jgi:hypothetical protein